MYRTMSAIAFLVLAAGMAQAQAQKSTQPNPTPTPIPGMTINRTPWFSVPQPSPPLTFNNDQQALLNKAYQQAWSRVDQSMRNLPPNLTDAQRRQQMAQIENTFHNEFNKSSNQIITNPTAQQRFQQLNLQYRGWGAFGDPTVQQQLKLTPDQQQRFTQLQLDWSNRINQLNQMYQTNPNGAVTSFNDMRGQFTQRLNGILTPTQQQQWQQMTGTPYVFPPTVYFQGPTGAVQKP
jgi:hypothetical protein